MGLKVSSSQLVAAAEAEVETLSVETANALLGKEGVQFVDIRDIRELQREGRIPGSFHAMRGMLEFWIDPDSPYYKSIFGEDKKFVFYCQSGWRSALATKAVQDMGMENVCHIDGGYKAWLRADCPAEDAPER